MLNFISYHGSVRKAVTELRALNVLLPFWLRMNVRGASFYEERGCIRSENHQFSNKRLLQIWWRGEAGGWLMVVTVSSPGET